MITKESGAVGLLAVSDRLTDVRTRECLGCYLERMLTEHGCIGLLFTIRWRDAQPAPMPALLPWLAAGGGYCDCEVAMNVFSNASRSMLFPKIAVRTELPALAARGGRLAPSRSTASATAWDASNAWQSSPEQVTAG